MNKEKLLIQENGNFIGYLINHTNETIACLSGLQFYLLKNSI
jgi:hypothetical protein